MVRFIHVSVVLLIIATMSTVAAWGQQKRAKRPAKPTPTLSDVKYGPHERNVLDFWKAKSPKPTRTRIIQRVIAPPPGLRRPTSSTQEPGPMVVTFRAPLLKTRGEAGSFKPGGRP